MASAGRLGLLGRHGDTSLLTRIPVPGSTRTVAVNRAIAPAATGLLHSLANAGYPLRDVQTYNDRLIRGGSSWSEHAFGGALDINPSPSNAFATTVPLPSNVRDIAAQWGFRWGGDFSRVDTPHFEALPKALQISGDGSIPPDLLENVMSAKGAGTVTSLSVFEPGDSGLSAFARDGGLGMAGAGAPIDPTNPGSIGSAAEQAAAQAGIPTMGKANALNILSGPWEFMGVTAVTTAGKGVAEATTASGKEQAEATKKAAEIEAEAQVDTTKSLTTTLTNLGASWFGNVFDLFTRGGVLIVGLVLLGIAAFVLSKPDVREAIT